MRQNNGLIMWLSFMAFLSSVAGAATLADLLPQQVVAGVVILNGGLQAATATYVAYAKPVETPMIPVHEDGTVI